MLPNNKIQCMHESVAVTCFARYYVVSVIFYTVGSMVGLFTTASE